MSRLSASAQAGAADPASGRPGRFAVRHPGQAKREPGSQKRQVLQCITIPDKASPFGDDGGGDDPLPSWDAQKALRSHPVSAACLKFQNYSVIRRHNPIRKLRRQFIVIQINVQMG